MLEHTGVYTANEKRHDGLLCENQDPTLGEDMDTNAWAILAKLLEMASGEFSNHGCNDFDLPNTPENRELMTALGRWNSEEEYGLMISKDGKTIYTGDSQLMSYFAHLARELAGIEE